MSEPFRPNAIYLSNLSRKGLVILARCSGHAGGSDALADAWIRERLAKEHPEIIEHLNNQEQTQSDFERVLTSKIVPFTGNK